MVGELTWRKRLLGLWAPLALFSVVALFPFTWMAATSLKTNAELYDPKAMPLTIRHPSLVHYISLLQETNFLTWIANTMLVAAVATGISLLLGTMLAYPLARMRFRGAPLLAITVAVTYLVPQSLLFVPMADLIRRLKLGNTLSAVMLTYPTLLVPFIAWLFMGYFKTVPMEVEDRTLIDVASRAHAALDPRDEIVERLLARLAVEPAVTGGAHHALDQQVVGAGGDRAAPVRLLEAQRYPRVAGLVQGDERRPEASSPFRVHRVRDR